MKKKQRILCKSSDIKIEIKQNKVFFLVGIGCIILGILLALKGIKSYSEENEVYSLVEKIMAGEYPLWSIFLFVILIPTLMSFSIILLSVNYYSIFLYYLELIIVNKLIFRNNIAGILHNFIPGLLSTVFISLPIIAIDFVLLMCFWCKVFNLIAYPCKRRILYIIPYRCYWNTQKNYFFQSLLSILFFNVGYVVFACLILTILF